MTEFGSQWKMGRFRTGLLEADVSKEIARFLNIPNPEDYTSHSIRRSGATILAKAGFPTEALRPYAGWKNASTAQIYIENTESNKKRRAESDLDSPTATKKPYNLHSSTPSKDLSSSFIPSNVCSYHDLLCGGYAQQLRDPHSSRSRKIGVSLPSEMQPCIPGQ